MASVLDHFVIWCIFVQVIIFPAFPEKKPGVFTPSEQMTKGFQPDYSNGLKKPHHFFCYLPFFPG
jgi:hypothetical protein